MMTNLLDLLTTGVGVGGVLTLAAAGVAVLPWSASDASRAEEAIGALVGALSELVVRNRASLAVAPARRVRGL